jgi:hypothetical protein
MLLPPYLNLARFLELTAHCLQIQLRSLGSVHLCLGIGANQLCHCSGWEGPTSRYLTELHPQQPLALTQYNFFCSCNRALLQFHSFDLLINIDPYLHRVGLRLHLRTLPFLKTASELTPNSETTHLGFQMSSRALSCF